MRAVRKRAQAGAGAKYGGSTTGLHPGERIVPRVWAAGRGGNFQAIRLLELRVGQCGRRTVHLFAGRQCLGRQTGGHGPNVQRPIAPPASIRQPRQQARREPPADSRARPVVQARARSRRIPRLRQPAPAYHRPHSPFNRSRPRPPKRREWQRCPPAPSNRKTPARPPWPCAETRSAVRHSIPR